jgi:glycosyltransferase involved in cell wall biosynthesis
VNFDMTREGRGQFIGAVIRSVIAQTNPSAQWITVGDGSTDATDASVKRFVEDHPWIELVRMPARRDSYFGAKVECFNTEYERIGDVSYAILGYLDADI